MSYSETARGKATAKYMQNKHTIRVVVEKEKAEYYKKLAEKSGKSLNKYIIDCIEAYSKDDKENLQ